MSNDIDYTEWGQAEWLLRTGKYAVKKITVKPHHRIPEEYHQQRDQHWVVIQGESFMIFPHAQRVAKAGDSMYIPRRIKHSISNTSLQPLVFIEIQTGHYLGEDDTVITPQKDDQK